MRTENDGYIDITQISIRHRISERQVRRYVAAGIFTPLHASHAAGRYIFDTHTVDQWFATYRPSRLPLAPAAPIDAATALLHQAWPNMTADEQAKLAVSLTKAANRSKEG